MPLPHGVDQEQLAEVGLAIHGLTAHGDRGVIRAWKGLDGAKIADRFLERHFSKP